MPSGRWDLERFLEEAQVLAGFDHAHINRVHRGFQAHGTAYLVLEYVSGETLSERLRLFKEARDMCYDYRVYILAHASRC